MLKYILLYLFLCTTSSMKAQVVSAPRKDSALVGIGNFRTVFNPSLCNDNFLLVVDGEVKSSSTITELDPDQIETILVLKSEAASFLFCNRSNLAMIFVNLKKTKRILEIVSSVDGSLVPFADVRIRFLNNGDSIVASTDANGRLELKNAFLDERCIVEVRAFQFQPIFDTISLIPGISNKIELAPASRELQAVIVSAKGKGWSCSFGCRVSVLTICLLHKNKEENELNDKLLLFPNPAKRGQSIRIDLQKFERDGLQIQVHQISGQKVYDRMVAGRQILSLPLDSRWAAGVYLVSVSTDKKILYREKIIVE